MTLLKLDEVEEKIIQIKEENVIIDSDVALLYGVETKHVNQAVRNNPEKFPKGYVIEISSKEWKIMKSNFLTSLSAGGKVKPPKAFTEKGLYMLATILKSPTAAQTTIAIVETFAKMKELSRTVYQLPEVADEITQQAIMRKSGNLIDDLLGNDLNVTDTETSFKFNIGIVEVKHTIKRKKEE